MIKQNGYVVLSNGEILSEKNNPIEKSPPCTQKLGYRDNKWLITDYSLNTSLETVLCDLDGFFCMVCKYSVELYCKGGKR